jgi:hypothetical protein
MALDTARFSSSYTYLDSTLSSWQVAAHRGNNGTDYNHAFAILSS